MGYDVPIEQAARAYYCSHLGKYVPGKAGVAVIRAALLRGRGAHPAGAALTAFYETITTLTTAAAIGIALSPWILQPAGGIGATIAEFPGFPYSVPILVALLCTALLPLTARAFRRLGAIVNRRFAPQDSRLPPFDATMLLRGSLWLVGGWCVHGLVVGCIIQSVTGEPFSLSQWPAWTAAVSLAVSGGFVFVFVPGGIGIREGILAEALHNQIGTQEAVLVALLLRAVSLFGECLAAGVLYYAVRPPKEETVP